MEYKFQRPSSVWVEVVVEADSLDEAIELADEELLNGNYNELDDTFTINYDRYWVEDENGEVSEDE
jgi:hypothetical protein